MGDNCHESFEKSVACERGCTLDLRRLSADNVMARWREVSDWENQDPISF